MAMVKLGKKADETTNEQVITGASATVLVEGHLTKEQRRELISCGRLRGYPGQTRNKKDAIDFILDSVKKMDLGSPKASPARSIQALPEQREGS